MSSSVEKFPPAPRSTVTVQRILDAARIVFGAKGLDAATMDNVADEAGLSKQIIYYYFANKDALYAETVRRMIVASHDPILRFNYAALDPIAALRTFFERAFDTNTSNAASFALDQMKRGDHSFMPGAGRDAYGRQVTHLLSELIARGQREGVVRAGIDPLMLHMHMWLLNVGFLSSRAMLAKYLGDDVAAPAFAPAWRDYAASALEDCLSPRRDGL